MQVRRIHWMLSLLLLAGLVLTSCAKKPAPTPPPPPPVETRETPPTPPVQPVQPPAETPAVTTGDFGPVFFDYDSHALTGEARSALDGNARLLRDNGGLQMAIEGHCDDRGTTEYNLALGERRAQAARDYLVGAGISAGRLQIVSYGKERPFASGADEASWRMNRRAHFTVRP